MLMHVTSYLLALAYLSKHMGCLTEFLGYR
jgi:hypothetical protein